MGEYLKLKKSNCKNCYKCIRNCPVKSIRFCDDQATIIEEDCVLCGQCFVVCPQNAKEISRELNIVKGFLAKGEQVIVSVAPSFIANYPNSSIKSIQSALQSVGVFLAEETALGATVVKNQYEKMMETQEKSVIISSCCNSINLLIQKYFPSLIDCLADIDSPMLVHAKDIKSRYPKAKVVFIGPCISKKEEAKRYAGFVDAVLTFDELSAWLLDEQTVIEKDDQTKSGRAATFPIHGGIIKSFLKQNPSYDTLVVDGMERAIEVLKDVENGDIHNCFIEMSACIGSCVGGPAMEKFKNKPVLNFQRVNHYALDSDMIVSIPDLSTIKRVFHKIENSNSQMPSEIEIKAVLKQMGKTKLEDELNCGSCGYETCREKAVAVYSKKADMSMCLPFLKEKAESFSDIIISNTPNGIIVLDEELVVQQINNAALDILNIKKASDVVGDAVVRILDPIEFLNVLKTGRSVKDKRTFLPEYKKYVDGSILYDKNYRILIYIIKDVTGVEEEKEEKQNVKLQTIDITDKVIDNQMKIVQEIAFLLGETAAETKIALTNLKELLNNE